MQFVVGYPGSGTTWIRAVIAAYALDDVSPSDFMAADEENGPLAKHLWSDIVNHHYQSSTPFALKNLGLSEEVRLRPGAMMLLKRSVSRAPGRNLALIHSHHAHCSVNGIHMWNGEWTTRVVNPIRDPREICCSLAARLNTSYAEAAEFMANTEAQFPPEENSEQEANDGEIESSAGHGETESSSGHGEEKGPEALLHHLLLSWSNHIRSWFQPENIPVLSVRYEDLCEDPTEAFHKILNFIGVEDVDEDQLSTAVETVRFDQMREAEEAYGFPEKLDGEKYFFRSGQSDGWKDELPSDVTRQIEDDHEEMMRAVGYL